MPHNGGGVAGNGLRVMGPHTEILIYYFFQQTRNMFNWTASAGRGLTFQLNYFRIKRLKKSLDLDDVEESVKEKVAKKDKLVCWAMSNCGITFTNRVNLAIDLVKNLPEKLHHFGKGTSCLQSVKDNVTFHGSKSFMFSVLKKYFLGLN